MMIQVEFEVYNKLPEKPHVGARSPPQLPLQEATPFLKTDHLKLFPICIFGFAFSTSMQFPLVGDLRKQITSLILPLTLLVLHQLARFDFSPLDRA